MFLVGFEYVVENNCGIDFWCKYMINWKCGFKIFNIKLGKVFVYLFNILELKR